MPAVISPFDDRFISLSRAATLAAGFRRGLDPDAVKDILARAIFAGAFDPPAADLFDEEALRRRDAPEHWPHIQIDAVAVTLTPEQASLRPRPQDYFAAGRATIASVMESLDALPGNSEQWARLLHDPELPDGPIAAFAALAKTPWRHYPETGRDYLEGVCLPAAKLKRWFALRLADLPGLLEDADDDAENEPNASASPLLEERIAGERAQGRPQKAAWDCIREAAFRLRAENPHMQMKGIAFEARALAAQDFPDDDLPSVATIQRKLGELLRGGSVH